MKISRLDESAQPGPAQWSLRTRLILLLIATAGLWAWASWSVYREAESESQRFAASVSYKADIS